MVEGYQLTDFTNEVLKRDLMNLCRECKRAYYLVDTGAETVEWWDQVFTAFDQLNQTILDKESSS